AFGANVLRHPPAANASSLILPRRPAGRAGPVRSRRGVRSAKKALPRTWVKNPFFGRYTPPMPEHAPDNAHRQAAWSRYWKQDVLHSLPGSFSGNYSGRIERFWLDNFAALGSGRRMLDIATGNGAIPQLACAHCAGRPAGMPRIDAIDLAQISPAWVASQPASCRDALHFHAGVSAESLPFADAAFDLVTSQYGIEYCDDARTAPEVARVLAPGGRVALLLHHAGSRLAEVAREELR